MKGFYIWSMRNHVLYINLHRNSELQTLKLSFHFGLQTRVLSECTVLVFTVSDPNVYFDEVFSQRSMAELKEDAVIAASC